MNEKTQSYQGMDMVSVLGVMMLISMISFVSIGGEYGSLGLIGLVLLSLGLLISPIHVRRNEFIAMIVEESLNLPRRASSWLSNISILLGFVWTVVLVNRIVRAKQATDTTGDVALLVVAVLFIFASCSWHRVVTPVVRR